MVHKFIGSKVLMTTELTMESKSICYITFIIFHVIPYTTGRQIHSQDNHKDALEIIQKK
jgi:hypothetical protein